MLYKWQSGSGDGGLCVFIHLDTFAPKWSVGGKWRHGAFFDLTPDVLTLIRMSRPKGSPNKTWPENWLPLLAAVGGTLGKLAEACNVSAPTAARWRDGKPIHETHAAVIKALAEQHCVASP